MKTRTKQFIKRLIDFFVDLVAKYKVGRYLYTKVLDNAMGRALVVEHRQIKLKISIPNALTRYRAETFSTKEPETLEWIDSIPSGAVLWDIGANVGLYTCYAAKTRRCRVFAFEPSVFNLELLARNIFLNELTDLVTIVPLPLADQLAFNKLNMTTTEWGGALSTFGQSYGQDGELLNKNFEIPTVGMSMSDAISLLRIPQPEYIKIDVDGIEHLILKGGGAVLNNVKSLSIEINDLFLTQANDSSKYLREAGLSFLEKKHCSDLDTDPVGRTIFNQIWIRRESV